MIYTTIDNASQLADVFRQYGRGDTFNWHGYSALYEYLEESGQDVELDVIALCCDFAQYDDLEKVLKDYGLESQEDLEESTWAQELEDGSWLVMNF